VAAPLHHEDEELHIFPPLLQPGTDAGTQAVVRQLQRDHVAMAACWPSPACRCRPWPVGGSRLFGGGPGAAALCGSVCRPHPARGRAGLPRGPAAGGRGGPAAMGVKWRRGAGAEPRRGGSALMHMRQGRDRVLWF
jgi:hypothetical protein